MVKTTLSYIQERCKHYKSGGMHGLKGTLAGFLEEDIEHFVREVNYLLLQDEKGLILRKPLI